MSPANASPPTAAAPKPENRALATIIPPKAPTPPRSIGFHHGSEYQPAGTGRPPTMPPG